VPGVVVARIFLARAGEFAVRALGTSENALQVVPVRVWNRTWVENGAL
jgi:hypothetical protein